MKTWIWLVLVAVVFLGIGTAVGNAMAVSKMKKTSGTATK